MTLSFGIIVPQGWRSDLSHVNPSDQYEVMRDVATEAEKLKYDAVYLYDHLHTVPFADGQPCYECWTTLSALASATREIRIGSLVTCNSYREPGLLAKMASSVDNISHGRLEFGIGAGWDKEEFNSFGYYFPSAKERIDRLYESVALIKKLWTSDEVQFSGRYYSLKKATCNPKPVQKPHPPVIIGGLGERLLLQVAARHADIWNFQGSLEELHRKTLILKKNCERLGRSPQDIRLSLYATVVIGRDQSELRARTRGFLSRERGGRSSPSYLLSETRRDPVGVLKAVLKKAQGVVGKTVIIGTPQECLDQLLRFKQLGISHFVVYVSDATELTPLRVLAQEVVRDLRIR